MFYVYVYVLYELFFFIDVVVHTHALVMCILQ